MEGLLQTCGYGPAHGKYVDHVARLGGEEFAVLMPDLDTAAAMAVAEPLRAAIAGLSVPVRGPGEAPAEVSFTASFGVAELGGSVLDLDRLLRAADEALYAAKAAGETAFTLSPTA